MSEYADAAGRYRLDSVIATGGMGVVWRATDTRLDRQVAVKVLKAEYAGDPTFRTRFEGEARSAAALHHPGIAGVYDYGSGDEAESQPPYLVMELVDGQPLSALLATARSNGRTMDTAVVQDLLAQASEALGVAHRAGIVHRDVKPANLLVTPDRKVKITDFGIARAADAVALTRTGSVMGTPQYLSPEQARGNPSTPASDVYSLGVVAFECLTGRRPFEAETPVATALAHLQEPVPELPDSVPTALAAVVRRALAKDPASRYADGAELATALRDPSRAGGAGMVAPAAEPEGATQVLPPVTGVLPAAEHVPPAPLRRLETPAAYAGTDDDEDRRRKSPWPIAVAVILLVVAAVVVAALLLGDDDETDPVADDTATPTRTATRESTRPTEPTTTEPTEEPTITIDEDDYLGRDYREVVNDLAALGLNPTAAPENNDGSQDPDRVSDLSWENPLHEGDQIVVSYWGPAPPPPETTPTTEPTEQGPPTDVSPPGLEEEGGEE